MILTFAFLYLFDVNVYLRLILFLLMFFNLFFWLYDLSNFSTRHIFRFQWWLLDLTNHLFFYFSLFLILSVILWTLQHELVFLFLFYQLFIRAHIRACTQFTHEKLMVTLVLRSMKLLFRDYILSFATSPHSLGQIQVSANWLRDVNRDLTLEVCGHFVQSFSVVLFLPFLDVVTYGLQLLVDILAQSEQSLGCFAFSIHLAFEYSAVKYKLLTTASINLVSTSPFLTGSTTASHIQIHPFIIFWFFNLRYLF